MFIKLMPVIILLLFTFPIHPAYSGIANNPISNTKKMQKDVIFQQVKLMAAEHFGLPASKVKLKTDMLRDLYADHMDVFDFIVKACEKFSVPIPKSSNITTVSALIDYISQQKDKANDSSILPRGIKERGFSAKKAKDQADPNANKYYERMVFFGTDRAPTGKVEPDYFFGGTRSIDAKIRYGICRVTIPATHKPGSLESPSIFKMELSQNPSKHIILKEISQMNYKKFMAHMQSQLNSPKQQSATSQDVILFIHGFNTSFSEAARRTAQLSFDLGFAGVPVMYSWPSNNSLLRYMSDRENVEWSSIHISEFLMDIASHSKAKRIHLIAHSMGNQGLIRALSNIASKSDKVLFENVIFAAPDFDSRTFSEQIAPKILKLSKHWTLYVSDKDEALKASEELARDLCTTT